MLPLKKILCPTDFSEPSLAALLAATELAQQFDAELHVLNVVALTPPPPVDMLVIATADYYPSDNENCALALQHVHRIIEESVPSSVRARSEVRLGQAAHEIVQAANNEATDMIVIGTHGASGWRHLVFGSVAEMVVRIAQCPVLTVHSGPLPESILYKNTSGKPAGTSAVA